jgi:hypothetical protein
MIIPLNPTTPPRIVGMIVFSPFIDMGIVNTMKINDYKYEKDNPHRSIGTSLKAWRMMPIRWW